MIDHAPRIRAQQKAQQENAEMAELEQRSAPLLWVVYVCVVALVLSFSAGLLRGHFERYADLASANEAMVQCLNGHLVNVDSVLVSCSTHSSELVTALLTAGLVSWRLPKVGWKPTQFRSIPISPRW